MYLYHASPQSPGVLTSMALEDGLSAADAGALIKKRRKERGLTQEQLVDKTGLSSQSYLSALEKGRYHIGRSEHFGAVAQVLRLSEADIRAINPAAVITVAAPEPEPGPASTRLLPPGLLDAVEEYGHTHPALRKPRVQEQLALVRHWDGGPKTARDWLDFYLDNRRRFTED